jgi:hypothetical protein
MNMNSQRQKYDIWIEADLWYPDDWTADDVNSDVMVTFEDGRRWVATFFTYQNILSLAQKNRETGECLGGRYFVATDMILVDEFSRERVQQVIDDLLEEEEFERYFDFCEESDDTELQ